MIGPKRGEPRWKSTLEPGSGWPQERGLDLGAREMQQTFDSKREIFRTQPLDVST